jgi:hypothetical protein
VREEHRVPQTKCAAQRADAGLPAFPKDRKPVLHEIADAALLVAEQVTRTNNSLWVPNFTEIIYKICGRALASCYEFFKD